MRNALAHVPKGQHTMVAAAIRQAFLQADAAAARHTWRHCSNFTPDNSQNDTTRPLLGRPSC
jgi:hypothetical protein